MQWPRNMQLIDANVILRYLLNDDPEISQKAKVLELPLTGFIKVKNRPGSHRDGFTLLLFYLILIFTTAFLPLPSVARAVTLTVLPFPAF